MGIRRELESSRKENPEQNARTRTTSDIPTGKDRRDTNRVSTTDRTAVARYAAHTERERESPPEGKGIKSPKHTRLSRARSLFRWQSGAALTSVNSKKRNNYRSIMTSRAAGEGGKVPCFITAKMAWPSDHRTG